MQNFTIYETALMDTEFINQSIESTERGSNEMQWNRLNPFIL